MTQTAATLRPYLTPSLGAAGGVLLAVLAPHIGCFGMLLALVLGAGAGASAALPLAYALGAIVVLAGIGAGIYAWRAPACTAGPRRLLGMALAGFVVMALVNTWLSRGFSSVPLTPEALENARALGLTPWDYVRQFCTSLSF